MQNDNQDLELKAEKAADELKINLPGANLPPVLRFLVLFMLAGGISIIGSILADIANPNQINATVYILRIVVGSLVITTAYGLIKLQRWAIWIYGMAIIIGLIVNPLVTILPLAVLVYLFFEREKFTASVFDRKLAEIEQRIKNIFAKNPPKKEEPNIPVKNV